MKVQFHPRAQDKLDEAVNYYEGFEPNLGLEFAEEVCAAVERIAEYPGA